MTAKDSKQNPIINGRIKLQTPSTRSVIINGHSTLLTPAGAWHSLDQAGEIAVIVPTKNISCQPINVQGLRNSASKTVELGQTRVDPAAKVLQRMNGLTGASA